MAALKQPSGLPAEDAVALGVRLMYEGEPPREAALHVMEQGVDEEAYEVFAMRGLAAILGDEAAATRHIPDGTADHVTESETSPSRPRSGRLHFRPTGAEKRARWLLRLEALYEGADGRMRSLVDFSLADWERLGSLYRARAEGLVAVADASDRATSILRKRKATSLAECPEADQRSVAEALRWQ